MLCELLGVHKADGHDDDVLVLIQNGTYVWHI